MMLTAATQTNADGGSAAIVIVLAVIALVAIFVFARSLYVVRPFEQGLVERLGKYRNTVDPGLRLILPFIESLVKIDMRERVVDVPPQEVITKDNVVVTVDAVVYYEATDPVKLQYNVENFILAATKLAQTNLRNVVGDLDLDSALTSREVINSKLREILDDATDKWGVRVVRVELQRIEPPRDVTESMHRQMKAERERRAAVLEADGQKQAQILKAEGLKRSQILEAEGHKESQVLDAAGEAEAIRQVADAHRYEKETVAEGEGRAIERVFGAIHTGDPTPDLIAIKYLESLGQIADGSSTKIFMPYESSGILGSIGMIGELFQGNGPTAFGRNGDDGTREPVSAAGAGQLPGNTAP